MFRNKRIKWLVWSVSQSTHRELKNRRALTTSTSRLVQVDFNQRIVEFWEY